MVKRMGLAILFLAFATLAGAASAGELDGKTFEVSMTEQDGEAQPDTLIFADGMFDSVECRQYGFDKAPYQVEKKADAWVFHVKTTSEEEGVGHWMGTVNGDSISGTMRWVKEGQDPITYSFNGKLQS